ncbi:ACT domain-containing protein [Chitinophaga sp. 22321]|uniref:ACT domain-containing protein n=1 Tax=Chitinophaga TaxID=79328 RepID=UPI002010D45E|nr:ACT domain-containing protein [Chitinophaga hostae]
MSALHLFIDAGQIRLFSCYLSSYDNRHHITLSAQGISCNVVAAYYHDHIFVAAWDAEKAIQVLKQLAD